jgi:hypothetical protein
MYNMDKTMTITAAIVACCDNCPWVNQDNLIQAAFNNPKWVEDMAHAWREVIALGSDSIFQNVKYVNSRLNCNLTANWINEVYNG